MAYVLVKRESLNRVMGFGLVVCAAVALVGVILILVGPRGLGLAVIGFAALAPAFGVYLWALGRGTRTRHDHCRPT